MIRKSYLTVLLLALFSATLFAHIDGKPETTQEMGFIPKTNIKANLLSPLLHTGSFFFERTINEKSSFQLGILATKLTLESTETDDNLEPIDEEINASGFAITPEFRLYVGKAPAPEGFFVAPYARYLHYKLTNDLNENAKIISIGIGLLVGQQYLFSDWVTFEWFVGPGYAIGKLKEEGSSIEDFEFGAWDGFTLRAGITLGISF